MGARTDRVEGRNSGRGQRLHAYVHGSARADGPTTYAPIRLRVVYGFCFVSIIGNVVLYTMVEGLIEAGPWRGGLWTGMHAAGR